MTMRTIEPHHWVAARNAAFHKICDIRVHVSFSLHIKHVPKHFAPPHAYMKAKTLAKMQRMQWGTIPGEVAIALDCTKRAGKIKPANEKYENFFFNVSTFDAISYISIMLM